MWNNNYNIISVPMCKLRDFTGNTWITNISHISLTPPAYLFSQFSITPKHNDSRKERGVGIQNFALEHHRDIGISTFPFAALHSATPHICETKRANNPACVMSPRSSFFFLISPRNVLAIFRSLSLEMEAPLSTVILPWNTRAYTYAMQPRNSKRSRNLYYKSGCTCAGVERERDTCTRGSR